MVKYHMPLKSKYRVKASETFSLRESKENESFSCTRIRYSTLIVYFVRKTFSFGITILKYGGFA